MRSEQLSNQHETNPRIDNWDDRHDPRPEGHASPAHQREDHFGAQEPGHGMHPDGRHRRWRAARPTWSSV